jgi:hypothetical protein
MATDSQGPRAAQRINVTVRPETFDRLHEARNKKGIEINVSQVADAAINAELDRREKPGIADLVARLRVESDLRRGKPYSRGYPEGERWAREVASWAEICRWAMTYDEKDVKVDEEVERISSTGWQSVGTDFVGKFRAPGDYNLAPCYLDEAAGDQVGDKDSCEQYWRGWLAGVKGIFEIVRTELEPIPHVPELPPPPETSVVPLPPSKERVMSARDVDPDDIPF